MGHLLKRKCSHSALNLRILSSTSVPFTLTTVQVLNLALTHKKRITVYIFIIKRKSYLLSESYGFFCCCGKLRMRSIIQEKDEEFLTTKKNFQRTLDSMQVRKACRVHASRARRETK